MYLLWGKGKVMVYKVEFLTFQTALLWGSDERSKKRAKAPQHFSRLSQLYFTLHIINLRIGIPFSHVSHLFHHYIEECIGISLSYFLSIIK